MAQRDVNCTRWRDRRRRWSVDQRMVCGHSSWKVAQLLDTSQCRPREMRQEKHYQKFAKFGWSEVQIRCNGGINCAVLPQILHTFLIYKDLVYNMHHFQQGMLSPMATSHIVDLVHLYLQVSNELFFEIGLHSTHYCYPSMHIYLSI